METSHTPDDKRFHYFTLTEKARKNFSILELIRKKGPISRSDISKTTDINIVSISSYIKDYLDKKLVFEMGLDVSTGGRRPELVQLNSDGVYAIGLEVGQTQNTAVMVNIAMDMISKVQTSDTANPVQLVEELIQKSHVAKDKIKIIGMGAQGSALSSAREAVEAGIGIETLAGDVAACAAFGEKRLNPQADVPNLLYIHSDVGCGIVVRGDIYFCSDAKSFKGAEYLRPWSDDMSIAAVARNEIEHGIGTNIVALADGRIDHITRDIVIDAARQGDNMALDIIQSTGMNLGVRIAYLVNLFSPEVVVIGGGAEKCGNFILEPVTKTIKKMALSEQAKTIRIIPSALVDNAVSLGAASLAVRELFLRA